MKDLVKEIKLGKHLDAMLAIDKALYEQMMDTTGFAYHWNEICKLATETRPPEPAIKALSLLFSKEQAVKADEVLKELKEQGRVRTIHTSADGNKLLYRIEFNLPFDFFIFGTKLADVYKAE